MDAVEGFFIRNEKNMEACVPFDVSLHEDLLYCAPLLLTPACSFLSFLSTPLDILLVINFPLEL